MTTLLLLRRPGMTSLSLGLGITTTFATYSFIALRPLRCDASPTTRNVPDTFRAYSEEAKVPVFRNGRPNPAAYKQLSAGSICGRSCSLLLNPGTWTRCGRLRLELSLMTLSICYGTGLLSGLALSTFSKTLAFLLGLAVFGVQVRQIALSMKLAAMKKMKVLMTINPSGLLLMATK